uniref:Solute carrier organic anion transporter family member n=1 Tax=Naja naja TaxID=35670 RepID=A0A8C6VNB3_NAJNA
MNLSRAWNMSLIFKSSLFFPSFLSSALSLNPIFSQVFIAALAFSYFGKTFAGATMKSSFTQLERRFGIASSTAGFIDGGFEMGNLLVIAFVSYFGAKCHRPKIIAIGCFIMSLGNCDHKIVTSYAWIFVLLGNLLRGIGETPITPLGISYLDDFSREEDVPLYISNDQNASMFGPLSGFLLGSVFARLYVDVGFVDVDAITISPTDSRWVGAWWMNFLVAGVVTLISGIPFLFLPKSLDKKEDAYSLRLSGQGKCNGLFFKSLKRILGNKLYLILLCSSLLNSSSFIGYITYQAKYMEQQYGLSVSRSNFITVVLLGMFLSGFIMKKYKLGILSATKMGYAASFIGFAFTFLYLMLGCDNHPVAGLTVTYDGNTAAQNPISLSSACNSNCTCATSQWDPVCGENGLTYMSACFAGCKNITRLKKKTVFHNCSCIGKADAALKNSSAVLGECRRSDECSKNFIFYTIVKAVSSFMYSLGGVPISVPQDLKSLAVGFMMLVIRSLGGIPAPVYFGAVIDKTCLKWGSKPCGQKGSCRIYDPGVFKLDSFKTCGLQFPEFLLFLLPCWLRNSGS